MDPTALYYALSTIAQVAAALAALIGFLGLWRLDQLKAEKEQADRDLRGLLVVASRISDIVSNAYHTDFIIEQAEQLVVEPRDDRGKQVAPKVDAILKRWKAVPGKEKWLRWVLSTFLVMTLVLILAPAIVGIVFVDQLKTWAGTPWLIGLASTLLAVAPAIVVLLAARRP